MEWNTSVKAAVAAGVIATLPIDLVVGQPQATLQISSLSMPQDVPDDYRLASSVPEAGEQDSGDALNVYKYLKQEFSISHTEMSSWLGVKRRTLYNWFNNPERASKLGPQIEQRLASLQELSAQMEPEHRVLLHKIAFSPIYGKPQFGEMLLAGATSPELVRWYEELFSQFESYRKISSKKEHFG
ncbi:MAG: hypothetical protein ABJL54_19730 [Halioglobus sp.]